MCHGKWSAREMPKVVLTFSWQKVVYKARDNLQWNGENMRNLDLGFTFSPPLLAPCPAARRQPASPPAHLPGCLPAHLIPWLV